jgi:hypothetical protein
MEAITASEHKACSVEHAEGVTASADVIGESFGGFVFRLDDDLDVTWDLHPFTLRLTQSVTITKAAWATALITVARTTTRTATTLTRRAVTTRWT